MNTRYTEMQRSIRGRWRPTWPHDASFTPLNNALNSALRAVEVLASHNEALQAAGKYSAQGLKEEMRSIARAETVPVLRRAVHAIETAQATTKARRAALAVPRAEDSNAAGAVLRGEMRTWLRGMPAAQALQILINDGVDERLLFAALEAPPAMSGLTEQMVGHVQTRVIERKFGGELARIKELEEAIELTGAAVGVALYQFRIEIGFNENQTSQFDAWMAEASVEVERQLDEKAPTLNVEWLSQEPSEFEKDVQARFDEIFAKAFPKLYPDHPVNSGASP